MTPPLRILHLEDSPRDAALVSDLLRAEGIEVEIVHVADGHAFREQLDRQPFDVILCDYNLPGYGGLAALEYARARQAHVPVLMVSGSIGEEQAVQCLHAGASDYLLKDRLQRLGSAVTRAARHAQAERERRDLELRFTRFAEQSDDIFWFMALEPERVIYVSPAVERVFGTPPAAHYASPRLWIEAISPDDRPRVLARHEAFVQGRAEYWEEYRVCRPDGSERHVVDRGMLVRDERGGVVGASGIASDVTERRELEEQFRQAQKMEAVGRLAGGIAHDFNNVLTIIGGFAGMVGGELGPAHPCQADLGEIQKAVDSASKLTRQLLAFSRRQTLQPVEMDLGALVDHNLHLLQRLVGATVSVKVCLYQTPTMIRADPGQLEQVLMNLAANARDAMPHGGTLTLTTTVSTLTSADLARSPELLPGRYVTLAVADTGHGMDADVMSRIFDPFFTTKSADRGTGLGLSTVHGIVAQSGGTIRASSVVGRGTTFTIYFPALATVHE